MRITDIMIDRYGVWSDLVLPVNEKGLTVIYGPNEAGKSTLMRFVRGVLYGFSKPSGSSLEQTELRSNWGGALRANSQHQSLQITRHIDAQGREQFRASNGNQTLSSAEYKELLNEIDGDVYRTIYTLGLQELRELATLQSDQISEYIYGTSLGVVGHQLLQAEQKVREQANQIVDPTQQTGKLLELSGKYETLHQALKNSDDVISKYEQTLQKVNKIETQQQERRQRLEHLKQEQTNYQYLSRIWNPWKRKRDLSAELRRLPESRSFTHDFLSQLEKLQRQKRSAEKQARSLKQQRQQLHEALNRDRETTSLREHASGIRALIDLRSMIESAEQHLAHVSADASMLKTELDEKLGSLGSNWNLNRLADVDTSPHMHLQLTTAARNYQTAIKRRARHRRKLRKVSDSYHQRQNEFQDQLKRQQIKSLPEAIREAEQRIGQLEQLVQLRVREAEYEQRIRSAESQLEKLTLGNELPWWAQAMLTLFALGGGFLVIAGLFESVRTGWLIGLIYLLTGIMGGALAVSMKEHYESNDHGLINRLRTELETCKTELNQIRLQITELVGGPTKPNIPGQFGVSQKHSAAFPQKSVTATPKPPLRSSRSDAELLKDASRRLVELQEMARLDKRLQKSRKTLSLQRGKLPEYQRDVSSTRQAWCDLLKQLGLDETVRTSEAFLDWQQVTDTQQTLAQWQAAKADVQRHQEILHEFRDYMQTLAGRMSLTKAEENSLTQTLSRWQHLLQEHEQTYETYQKRQRQYRELNSEYKKAVIDFRRVKSQYQKLLDQLQVQSVEEYRQRGQKYRRAEELRALITDLDDQLNALSQEEPHLAITEEDLLEFDQETTQERVDLIGLEIEDLEQDLAQAQEELGRHRQAMSMLEQDTTEDDLKFEQSRLLDQAALALRDLQANRIAASAFSRMTSEFEHRFQPETLKRASNYLSQLTCLRYQEIRTPFQSRELMIQEQNGPSRHVNELSDGTREQVFLAIRLALIDVLAERGVEMPMIFDDIFVNFDQQRTEAAVQTLLEFSRTHQLLFFTCHQHLAKLFGQHSVEPIWLPSLMRNEKLLAG